MKKGFFLINIFNIFVFWKKKKQVQVEKDFVK
jgi:hypothetical protein